MSKETKNNADLENKNKVSISNEDCANVVKYASHFNVPLSAGLDLALKKFSENNSFENQLEIKLEVCKWMLTCTHESFQDSLWDAPKKAAESVVFDLQFDKDLKETLNGSSDSKA
jgi:hypothetical protein